MQMAGSRMDESKVNGYRLATMDALSNHDKLPRIASISIDVTVLVPLPTISRCIATDRLLASSLTLRFYGTVYTQ